MLAATRANEAQQCEDGLPSTSSSPAATARGFPGLLGHWRNPDDDRCQAVSTRDRTATAPSDRRSRTLALPLRHPGRVQRVVVLGRGGAGKTTAARQLAHLLQVSVIELDQVFWSADLTQTPPDLWAAMQSDLASTDRWVIDGDLGLHDVLAPRLARADTVLILEFGLARCLWRAARRSGERLDFWSWVITWRHRARPALLTAVTTHAPQADLHIVQTPHQLRWLLHRAKG